MKFLKSLGAVTLFVGIAGVWVFFAWLPGKVEKRMNSVAHLPPYRVATDAIRAHGTLFIVDLHADSLLWARDLLQRGDYGHVDVPRLIQGGVGLQVFGVVTKVPSTLNIERNPSDARDQITLLSVAQRWPVSTWRSLAARASHQAGKLRELAQRSNDRLILVTSRLDLERLLVRRAAGEHVVGGLLALEGAHALEGNLDNVDALVDAGYRMVGLAHFFDNEVGGSAHGERKGGITEFGKAVVERLQALHVVIDLAHASPALFDDVLSLAKGPVVVSHTGVRGTCENRRNLSDDQLRGIAATGGVVGIGYWKTAVCGEDPSAVAKAVHYAVDVVGIDHVALGSDFDGAVQQPFDTTGVIRITEALLDQGFVKAELRRIMGENALRVFRATLLDE